MRTFDGRLRAKTLKPGEAGQKTPPGVESKEFKFKRSVPMPSLETPPAPPIDRILNPAAPSPLSVPVPQQQRFPECAR
jgi:hypothetical protein